jgi:hypothetical protein
MDENRAACQRAQPLVETTRRRQCSGVKLGIAAGQPDRIGAGIGCLVGKRRKGQDLRTGRAPAIEQVGIDEGEGRSRQRDALSGGGSRVGAAPVARALRALWIASRSTPLQPASPSRRRSISRARRPAPGRDTARAGRSLSRVTANRLMPSVRTP